MTRERSPIETQFPTELIEQNIFPVGLPVNVGEVVNFEVRDILLGFESLGENCEFGLIQRRYTAEPLGLFRWAQTKPEALIEILGGKFEGFGDIENTEVKPAPWGELIAYDKNYSTAMHTFIHKSGVDLEAFTINQCRRISYLKRKILDDLSHGEKIFVYQAGHRLTESLIRKIYSLLSSYGKNRLLVVNLETKSKHSGQTEVLDQGLMRGYIERFGKTVTENGTRWDINYDAWISICRSARLLLT